MESRRLTYRTAPWRLAPAVAVLLAAGGFAAVRAAPPAAALAEENLYTALIEPSLADDGRLSPEEERAILAVAEKVLDNRQREELKKRMAAHLAAPARPAAATVTTADAAPLAKAPEQQPDCLPCDCCLLPCEPSRTVLLDNVAVFGGLDGSKGPEDLGINANFGFRAAVNAGLPLLHDLGLGIQAGTAVNYSHTAVAVLETIDGTRERTQSFTTLGVFQRTAAGLSWGLAYDFLSMNYYEHIDLGQWRAQLGFAFRDSDEIGIWGTKDDRGASAAVAGVGFHLRPIQQGNIYWRHTWDNDAVTRIWVGVAEQHDRFVFVLPPQPAVHHPVVFGADLHVPLSDRLALFGEANFITPNDSGTVTAFMGFAWHLGGKARTAARSRFAPLLPVANNPTFAVDLER